MEDINVDFISSMNKIIPIEGAGQMSTQVSSQIRFSSDLLNGWIERLALDLSDLRKLERLVHDLRGYLRSIPSNKEEMENDWFNACTFCVSKILHGDVNLVNDIEPEAYRLLEEKCFHEAKELKAYYIGEGRKSAGHQQDSKLDYYTACEEIRELLVNENLKASLNDFIRFEKYLETHYLTNGQIDEDKPAVRELIEAKASRIRKTNREDNEAETRRRAKAYIKMFYENIIPAVMKKDFEKTLTVLKAFQFCRVPKNCYLIINSFEAALAIYFLDSSIIQKIWKESEGKEFEESNTVTEEVQSWPRAFVIPKRCEHLFKFEKDKNGGKGGKISILGIITKAQKEELLKSLSGEEQIKAVERLCIKSRVLPRNMTL